jgi:hypothetical protein
MTTFGEYLGNRRYFSKMFLTYLSILFAFKAINTPKFFNLLAPYNPFPSDNFIFTLMYTEKHVIISDKRIHYKELCELQNIGIKYNFKIAITEALHR